MHSLKFFASLNFRVHLSRSKRDKYISKLLIRLVIYKFSKNLFTLPNIINRHSFYSNGDLESYLARSVSAPIYLIAYGIFEH